MINYFALIFFFLYCNGTYSQKIVSVSVENFGANGGDLIEDTESISNTIKYAIRNNIKIVNFGKGTFYVSRGILLCDGMKIMGSGMDKTKISLIRGLKGRTSEADQTAIFTSAQSYSLSSNHSTNNILIKNLTINLNKPENEFSIEQFSMLGGIRLINPKNCIIDSVRIIRPQKFGIGLFATKGGLSSGNNKIKNCVIEMQPDWYLQKFPVLIPRNDESCIGIEIASYAGEHNNGASLYLNRNNKYYFPSKMKRNIVSNNKVTGGSHGISLINTNQNTVSRNKVLECSARGIIIISTCDENNITKNFFGAIGSTAIHLAYNCTKNIIRENEVDGVLGIEGDGIKSYINCNENTIYKNKIKNFRYTGIRVSHGANKNSIKENIIIGNRLADQTGIKIVANNKIQFAGNLKFDNKLGANFNECLSNKISSVHTGILIMDEMNFNNSVKSNKIAFNIIEDVSIGISKGKSTLSEKNTSILKNSIKSDSIKIN